MCISELVLKPWRTRKEWIQKTVNRRGENEPRPQRKSKYVKHNRLADFTCRLSDPSDIHCCLLQGRCESRRIISNLFCVHHIGQISAQIGYLTDRQGSVVVWRWWFCKLGSRLWTKVLSTANCQLLPRKAESCLGLILPRPPMPLMLTGCKDLWVDHGGSNSVQMKKDVL